MIERARHEEAEPAHRSVVMAIERGKLQNFIFDNHALASHRALATLLGAVLKLPPLKQALANEQLHGPGHLPHARPADRPFIADDHRLAIFDVIRQQALQAGFLAFKNARWPR